MSIQQIFEAAVRHQQAGRFAQAFESYQEVLRLDGQNHEALYRIGTLFYQTKRYAEGLQYFEQAGFLQPNEVRFQNSIGLTLLKLARLEDAEKVFRQLSEIEPTNVKALLNLAKALRLQDKLNAAASCLRKATEIDPASAIAWNQLGNILHTLDQSHEALACYERVLEIDPQLAEAHANRASIYRIQGDLERAIEGYERSLELKPNLMIAHRNLGELYLEQRKYPLAIECFRKAIASDVINADLHQLLGKSFAGNGQADPAVRCYMEALRHDPKHVAALIGCGNVCFDQGDVLRAMHLYQDAVDANPDCKEAVFAVGVACHYLHKDREAIEHFERVLEIDPDSRSARIHLTRVRAEVCDWQHRSTDEEKVKKILSQILADGEYHHVLPLLDFHLYDLPGSMHIALAKFNAQRVEKNIAHLRTEFALPNFSSKANKRLRVGYLSPDLRDHPVGRILCDVFRYHNRDRFEVTAYALVVPPKKDEIQERIRSGCERFVDLSKISYLEAAKRIAQDQIDLLVDLGGYTTYTKPEIAALRPAPVQAQYLGYPNTMAIDSIPYLFADSMLIPEDLANNFTEKIVYLPHTFVSSSWKPSDRPLSRKDFGLPTDEFVFCCFNQTYKISPTIFQCWMNILRRVKGSVLWFLSENKDAQRNLQFEAGQRGIDGDRLVFSSSLPYEEHIARIKLADLFLDTLGYNAATTAVGLIASGVPVITKPGDTYASRMGASVCHSAGLSELVCNSINEYEDLAVDLAHNANRLHAIRRTLSNVHEQPLFNIAQFTRSLERAYEEMWEIHKSGNDPRSFRVDDL